MTAAYTANVFGGQASFQPIPTLVFRPKTYLTLNATANLIPGLVSAGASKTIRFDPLIRISPTDTGGVTVGFAPRLEVELSGAVRAGLTNIFNTGLGVNGGWVAHRSLRLVLRNSGPISNRRAYSKPRPIYIPRLAVSKH
ncbi:hypothetical protein RHM66_05230 [Pseudomonas sp. RTB3]|nr:hypothetical protein RHM66_05230 [Pseudomonas sp. RTB3]